MRNFFKTSLLILTLLALILVPFNVYAITNPSCISDSPEVKCNFKMLERKLWIDHVLWTRSFIVSDIASLEDKNDVLHRLFKNQDDIGNSIKPYYGEEAGNKLAVLLRDHIALAGKVLEAAKNKNKDELDKYNKLWYDNADKIADFLSSANPNYNNKELKDMLYKHLQFVTDQVVARLNNNWKDDIESFDKGENHIINFADIISDGIIKQFPEKFQ
ncbi:glycosyltransferase [Clostridium septicum]|uniref:Glycosyltransferase n=2 Tax=Clostridium septicum TaxID=1504 RepID=A0A9N7JJF1_CLOSE|nr:glycosyltransferase [Clostridium septicum]AYE33748.1 glycosyltransferase [Clostridium septicum]MDU1313731.1 glycosyltransferase [Clostridium septicum]UEC21641.1 glycosyltransferase [Clostridium septicum]USS00310.1 glycosyltransferase [Clostridium septicum]WLF68861.1 glycosyltransferase [Clostridium septicum]